MSRIARLLNSSVEVWRKTRVSDGMGGWVTSWANVSGQRARFSQPTATERVSAGQQASELSHVVYLLPTADVRRDDELRARGRVFQVLAVFEPSEPGTYLRADCKYIQAGV